MRLKTGPPPEQRAGRHQSFGDLLSEGTAELRAALPKELTEPGLRNLPRLVFASNRQRASRLRQLIDHLNKL
ncbi:MAG: hypothetical protein SCG73_08255 [Nitrospiraceae bacterium]|nr:hypothetical protein [Nitrospiraceae bacterium]